MQPLITIGRTINTVSAVVTILIFGVTGWLYGTARDFSVSATVAAGHISATPVLYSILGLAAGLIVAGAVFGVVAAIFDMQQSLRILSNRAQGTAPGDRETEDASFRSERNEPRLRTGLDG